MTCPDSQAMNVLLVSRGVLPDKDCQSTWHNRQLHAGTCTFWLIEPQ